MGGDQWLGQRFVITLDSLHSLMIQCTLDHAFFLTSARSVSSEHCSHHGAAGNLPTHGQTATPTHTSPYLPIVCPITPLHILANNTSPPSQHSQQQPQPQPTMTFPKHTPTRHGANQPLPLTGPQRTPASLPTRRRHKHPSARIQTTSSGPRNEQSKHKSADHRGHCGEPEDLPAAPRGKSAGGEERGGRREEKGEGEREGQ